MANEILVQKDLAPIRERFIELTDPQTFDREASFALQHIAKSKQLQQCSKGTLIAAVMNVANFGLSLNPVKKEAYIVPRFDKSRGMLAYLEPSYMGLIKAVTEVGQIIGIEAQVVYDGDDFDFMMGLENKLEHRPRWKSKNIACVYAIATLAGGTKQLEVMSIEEIQEVRETSSSYMAFKRGKISSCIWVDWFSEMARKTVVRRICKYLPKRNNDRLQDLIAADETDYMPTINQMEYCSNLLRTSTYDHEEVARLQNLIDDMTKPELDNLIIEVQNNQQDPREIMMPTQKDLGEIIKRD